MAATRSLERQVGRCGFPSQACRDAPALQHLALEDFGVELKGSSHSVPAALPGMQIAHADAVQNRAPTRCRARPGDVFWR